AMKTRFVRAILDGSASEDAIITRGNLAEQFKTAAEQSAAKAAEKAARTAEAEAARRENARLYATSIDPVMNILHGGASLKNSYISATSKKTADVALGLDSKTAGMTSIDRLGNLSLIDRVRSMALTDLPPAQSTYQLGLNDVNRMTTAAIIESRQSNLS